MPEGTVWDRQLEPPSVVRKTSTSGPALGPETPAVGDPAIASHTELVGQALSLIHI